MGVSGGHVPRLVLTGVVEGHKETTLDDMFRCFVLMDFLRVTKGQR